MAKVPGSSSQYVLTLLLIAFSPVRFVPLQLATLSCAIARNSVIFLVGFGFWSGSQTMDSVQRISTVGMLAAELYHSGLTLNVSK